MGRDLDKEKIFDKMRELRDNRDREFINNADVGEERKDKVLNVKYLGEIEWEEEIDGQKIKAYKGIYLEIEQKVNKDGQIIQIERYYTEDGEILGGNNRADNYNYFLPSEKYKNNEALLRKLETLDKNGILNLNEMEQERLEEIAKVIGIKPEEINKLAEISEEEISNAEKELDEKEGKGIKETISEKEINKISSKTEINPNQKVTDKETMESLLNVQGKHYKKIAVIYSEKLQENGNGTKFSIVGINKDGSAEKIDNLEQVSGITPNEKVYGMDYDGSNIKVQQQNSIYRVKGTRDSQIGVKIGPMGTIETSLVRTSQSNSKEAISVPIQNKYNMNSTTGEVRGFMNDGRNYKMNEEINRIKAHKDYCTGDLSKRDIDDNPYNDTHNHGADNEIDGYIIDENGKKYTYSQLATRWGFYKEGKPDSEYAKEKFKELKENNEGKTTSEVINSGDEEYADPRINDSKMV